MAVLYSQQGPLFHNLVISDENKPCPCKSAISSARSNGREEITEAQNYPCLSISSCDGTNNPIEQEGTISYSKHNLTVFWMHLEIDYPGAGDWSLKYCV